MNRGPMPRYRTTIDDRRGARMRGRLLRFLRVAVPTATLLVGLQWAGPAPAGATGLTPPPVPGQNGNPPGVYLGAWVDPIQHASTASQGASATNELAQIGNFDAAFGRPLAIAHVFQKWAQPAPVSVLTAMAATGTIPLIDWHCGDWDANVANASPTAANPAAVADYNLISQYAQELKAYGRPVFLRWYWEFNILGSPAATLCLDNQGKPVTPAGAYGFRKAWQNIWAIFHNVVGATNVSFVWCPGLAGTQALTAFYPGNQFVDWICVDGYDRTQGGLSAFASNFGDFYKARVAYTGGGGLTIPVMVGETGATTDQADYFKGMYADIKTQFPDIKAVVYFDGDKNTSSNQNRNWTLTASGFAEWAALGADPYFSFHG